MEYPQIGGDETPQKGMININAMYCTSGIACTVSTLFLAACLCTTYFILHEWRFQHYMILLAWMFTIAGAITLASIHNGTVNDAIWEILVANLVVIPGTVLAKLVICVIYYSALENLWFRYPAFAIRAVVSLIICPFAALWVVLLLEVSGCEQSQVPCSLHCRRVYAFYVAQAVIGVMADMILMFTMLVCTLRNTQSRKDRMRVVVSVGSGIFPLGAVVVRFVILVIGLKNNDPTPLLANGIFLLSIESNIVIVCSSAPMIRKFKHNPRCSAVEYPRHSAVLDGVQGDRGVEHTLNP
ncbi:uncharacterized protein BKA55DRAFT_657166 [Fusarium redolens]|uniref:Rhodopsin domain-containing protein n=1 Tax=Fusarium redolens TaxID=48865 RepID=A0A9P9FWK3_FUSRE|nr:uncharacterized protein BKA55DRAFT_657166 [Fusarium redolens]KAH7208437.1 hypothetical protein BKA55DRAFT_657166 [Fusarium redolens]